MMTSHYLGGSVNDISIKINTLNTKWGDTYLHYLPSIMHTKCYMHYISLILAKQIKTARTQSFFKLETQDIAWKYGTR